MKRETLEKLPFCCALLCLALAMPVLAQQNPSTAEPRLMAADAGFVSVTATVEAIDLDKRELTLKGPLGNVFTLIADEKVKRLDEIKTGDTVKADYYVSYAAELREPTLEEAKHPMEVVETAGKSSPDRAPGAGAMRWIKAVTTIEGLDRPTSTITVKGPLGRYVTARVADPSKLPQMRIGETIVVTYTEAMAISVEKVSAKGME
ncbi:MAG: hypothetical protein AB1640_24160 [bacterium]